MNNFCVLTTSTKGSDITVRIQTCKPDKTKGKGQDKMRNDTQEFTWFTQIRLRPRASIEEFY